MGKYFDMYLEPATVRQLTDDGFLVPFEIFGPSVADLSKLKVRAGEFTEESLTETFDKGDIVNFN